MTMFSFLVRTGNLIFLLPLLLKNLSAGELSVYYLFQMVLGFTNILIGELGMNFVRTLAFVQGGADEEDLKDLRFRKGGASEDDVKVLSSKVIATIHRSGIYATLLVFVVLVVCGSPTLVKPLSYLDVPWRGWASWAFFVIVTAWITFGGNYGHYIQGLGEVALFRRWEGFVVLLSIVAGVIALLLNGGLFELILAQQGMFAIGIIGRRVIAMRLIKRRGLSLDRRLYCDKIFGVVWSKTWKTASGVFMHSGVFRLTGLFFAQKESPEVMASFLLSVKLMTIIVDFCKAPFYSKIPRMAKNAAENIQSVLTMAQKGFLFSMLLYVGGVLFVAVAGDLGLRFIGSNTPLCPPMFWMLLGAAYFVERYAAMHLNLYTLSNHIIWHRVYLVSGTLYLALLLALYPVIGIISFPVALLVSELLFSSWYSAYHSLKLMEAGFFSFEKKVSFVPLLLMCIYVGVILLIYT